MICFLHDDEPPFKVSRSSGCGIRNEGNGTRESFGIRGSVFGVGNESDGDPKDLRDDVPRNIRLHGKQHVTGIIIEHL